MTTVHAVERWQPRWKGDPLNRDGTEFALSLAGWDAVDKEGLHEWNIHTARATADEDSVTVRLWGAGGMRAEIRFRQAGK